MLSCTGIYANLSEENPSEPMTIESITNVISINCLSKATDTSRSVVKTPKTTEDDCRAKVRDVVEAVMPDITSFLTGRRATWSTRTRSNGNSIGVA